MKDKPGSSTNKFEELIDGFRSVMGNRGGFIDSLIPPIVFIILMIYLFLKMPMDT